MMPAVVVLVLAILWRIVTAHVAELANFSPLMALAFCGGVYFRSWRVRAIPFAALILSDVYLSVYYASLYHYGWTPGGEVLRIACFAAGLGLGVLVSTRRSWMNLLSGALGGSLLFYIVTNTAAWYGASAPLLGAQSGYAQSFAGWWQALTVGHPGYPPTLFFFRNTLVSDLLFTGAFAFAMEAVTLRRGEASLLKGSRA